MVPSLTSLPTPVPTPTQMPTPTPMPTPTRIPIPIPMLTLLPSTCHFQKGLPATAVNRSRYPEHLQRSPKESFISCSMPTQATLTATKKSAPTQMPTSPIVLSPNAITLASTNLRPKHRSPVPCHHLDSHPTHDETGSSEPINVNGETLMATRSGQLHLLPKLSI